MHRIVLNADIYKEVYKEQGYESRLLSRTTEDAATVTSVLIPWNTRGMTQSTVLGVPTLTYLPYCFFNYLSPLMSIFTFRFSLRISLLGWGRLPRACIHQRYCKTILGNGFDLCSSQPLNHNGHFHIRQKCRPSC